MRDVGLSRVGPTLDPAAGRPATFPQLLDIVASLPYDRRLKWEGNLRSASRSTRRGSERRKSIFLEPADLNGLTAEGCEAANHTRSHIFCRSLVDEASRALEPSSMLDDSSR